MSMGPENFSDILNDFPGSQPQLCRHLSTPTCPRFNTHHLRSLKTSLQRHDSFSPHDDSKLFEQLSGDLPVRTTRLSQSIRQPRSSFLVSYQPRDHLKAQFLEKKAMILENEPALHEPESSTSRPSEIVSPLDRISSPSLVLQRVTSSGGELFNNELYTRVEEFLDAQDLNLTCPSEQIKGIRCFSKLFMASRNNTGQSDESDTQSTQSDHAGSSKLISDNIISSSLFQRRASRSQEPEEIGNRENPLTKKRPAKLCVFRHFDEHINHCLQVTSPIQEAHTPILSCEKLKFLEKENLPVLKKYFPQRLPSPVLSFNESQVIALPPLPTLKQSQSFFSPNLTKPKPVRRESSPLRNLSSRSSGTCSLCSSPTQKNPFKNSPRISLHQPKNMKEIFNLNDSRKNSKFRYPPQALD